MLLGRHLLDTKSLTDLRGGLISLYHKPAREIPCAHFIDEETEAWGGEVTWLRYSHLDSNLDLCVFQTQIFPHCAASLLVQTV